MTSAVETPSGKNAGTENFPVGSWLLPARLRPHVAIFYGFARAIDDIADNPTLAAEEKIRRLDGFATALEGRGGDDPAYAKAHRLRESLIATHVTTRHGLDLIAAFKQDAVKLRYRDWADLIGYCNLSAAPVGRYLLDLHGESRTLYPPVDALCNALQVINHLQDCQDDYRTLDRVYLPGDWLEAAGIGVDALETPQASPALRQVLDRCLDGTEALLAEAKGFPERLKSWHLGLESGVILSIAERLAARLRRQDPLAARVALGGPGFLGAAVVGAARTWLGRRN